MKYFAYNFVKLTGKFGNNFKETLGKKYEVRMGPVLLWPSNRRFFISQLHFQIDYYLIYLKMENAMNVFLNVKTYCLLHHISPPPPQEKKTQNETA